MKKSVIYFSEFILGIALIAAVCTIFTVASCLDSPSKKDGIGKLAEIDIPECEIVFYENTHGGFHGDGHTGAVLEFTQENAEIITKNITDNEHWKPLPMTEFTEALFFCTSYNDYDFDKNILSGYLPEKITEGYWFCYNEQTGEYFLDYDTFREANSCNYVIALYDSANLKLYFYSLDT